MPLLLALLVLMLCGPAAAAAAEELESGPYSVEMAREEAGYAGRPAPRSILGVPGAVVGTATVRLTKSGRVSLRVRLTKTARRRLARARSVALTVAAQVTSADGKAGQRVTRRVVLRR